MVWIILLATMLVDIDHLFAEPIFDPNRCSVGFHYLHSYYAIAVYFLLLLFGNKIVRIVALGLLLHMATDFQDCLWQIPVEFTGKSKTFLTISQLKLKDKRNIKFAGLFCCCYTCSATALHLCFTTTMKLLHLKKQPNVKNCLLFRWQQQFLRT